MRIWPWVNRVVVAAMIVVTLAALGAIGASLAIKHANYHMVMMETGSMRGVINPGDIAVIRPVAPTVIRVGDIITFREPLGAHEVVTHRVAQVLHGPLGLAFDTKGDRNGVRDPWVIHYTDGIAWRLAFVIPWVGHVPVFLQSRAGHLAVLAAIFLLTLVVLWPLIGSSQSDAEAHGQASALSELECAVDCVRLAGL